MCSGSKTTRVGTPSRHHRCRPWLQPVLKYEWFDRAGIAPTGVLKNRALTAAVNLFPWGRATRFTLEYVSREVGEPGVRRNLASGPGPSHLLRMPMSRSFLRLILSQPLARLRSIALGPGQMQRDRLATTTSTQDTGLLDSLLPMFQRETCIAVKPIAVGTGAALEMARRGDADAVLVHAPEAEKPYVQSGELIDGRLIMHNDFLIIGPEGDPARVRGRRTRPRR